MTNDRYSVFAGIIAVSLYVGYFNCASGSVSISVAGLQNAAVLTAGSHNNAQPEDVLDFVFQHRDTNLFPGGKIPIRNNSDTIVRFYAFADGAWQPLFIRKGAEAELPFDAIWLAIGTNLPGQELSEITVDPAQIKSESIVLGSYFIRDIKRGARYEFCLEHSNRRWIIRELEEAPCH